MRLIIALFCVSLLSMLVKPDIPPKITYHPPAIKYLVTDADKQPKFKCTAEGTPNITYTWRRKTEGDDWKTLQLNLDRTVVDGALTMHNPKSRDNGLYQCIAKNNRGSALSETILLQVAKIGDFPTDEIITHENANVGDYKSIECRNPPNGNPPSSYSWLKDKNINDEHALPITGKEFAVDPNGKLHILRVDKKHDSSFTRSKQYYMCGAYNRIKRTKGKGSPTTLTVSDTGPVADRLPNFRYVTKNTQVVNMDMEENITLMCIAHGSPKIPKIFWKRGGKDIATIESLKDRYTLARHDRMLYIRNVQEDDEGNDYECYTDGGQLAISHTMSVKVTSKPIPVPGHVPGDQILLHGDAKTFECEGRSANKHSQVSIKWFEGSTEITNDFPNRKVEGSRLTVTNVRKPQDIRSLACVMTNDYGTRYFSFRLNVIEDTRITQRSVVITNHTKDGVEKKKPLVFHLSERGRTVVVTDDITIDMLITVKVDILVKKNLKRIWKRNGKEIKSSDPSSAVYMNDRYHVILNSTTKQKDRIDELVGNYTCEIDVDVPSAKKVLMINFVKEIIPEVIPVVAKADFPFWVLGLILGLLLLILVITLIICVMYRNRGGIWKVDEKEREAGNNIEKELADSGFHDLGRADGPDEEKKPIDQRSLSDDDPPPGEDTASLDEYGEPDMSKFNEEGSFIDMYGQTRSRNEPTQRPNSLNYGPEDQQTLTDNVTPPPSYYPPIPPNNRHTNRSFTNDTMV